MRRVVPAILVLLTLGALARAEENLVRNGGFEEGLNGWSPFWSRSGDGTAELTQVDPQAGRQAVHVRYPGQQDWSFPQTASLDVQPGDIFELSGWIRTTGSGRAALSVILYDAENRAISWSFGGTTVSNVPQWRFIRSRFVIPNLGTRITPRLMGHGPADVWLDDVSLTKTGTLDQLKAADLPESVAAESRFLRLNVNCTAGTMTVTDLRTGRTYSQHPGLTVSIIAADCRERTITLRLLKPDDVLTIEATIQLEEDAPEWTVALSADGEMREPLQFPAAFATRPGELLIMPVNEGISYPVDDESLPDMEYHLYGGHGLCMSFWGTTDLKQGLMAIVETPDDARVGVPRVDGRLCLAPAWLPQKTAFGPARRIRYICLEDGGYVAMCKRYRAYARQAGRCKTLAEKRQENPHVDLLVGAVNVWNWDLPAPETCAEMQRLGIERILWSRRAEPEQVRRLNDMGVLSSRYDIYQDVMNPANFSKVGYQHPDWTSDAWPDDVIVRQDGSYDTGWAVKGKDGQWYPCAVLCDSLAVDYARRRVPPDLETHPYRCRFIDTTTAAAWRECYHPNHPMTRSDSRRFRMELLAYMSNTSGLVTGSETGHDAAVPYVCYFEGMLSLGPYRVDDAGRDMQRQLMEVPEQVAKFQTGHFYRLPLWELVYHDCVVAQWYWGDYNNKLPPLWDRRDLFNALYGTPPMFMFNRRIWKENRDRFVQSYRTATPVARATGYCEMLSHEWLTPDHAVQQTRFANGVVVTVNFGEAPYTTADGVVLEPLSMHAVGLETAPEG